MAQSDYPVRREKPKKRTGLKKVFERNNKVYKQGKKVNKTVKYTFDEMRKIATQTAVKSQLAISQIICNLAIMAHIDTPKEATPEDYIQLFEKYIKDYNNGEFSAADLKKYNVSSVKEIYKK